MQRFNFDMTDSYSHLPDPNDHIYQLEYQVERMDKLPPTKQLALLYNDASNYKMAKMYPMTEWYVTRIRMIREYAMLDWLALGEHLNPKSMTLGNLCTTIHRQLHELIQSDETFNIAMFCSVLSKIDHLWHIILPSHLEDVCHPNIITLLKHCGQITINNDKPL
jgi:hypothetical protein